MVRRGDWVAERAGETKEHAYASPPRAECLSFHPLGGSLRSELGVAKAGLKDFRVRKAEVGKLL